MKIAGFQKLSFIDYPGIICSIVFTQGCLFRCPYCHNPELVDVKKEGVIPEDEVLDFLHSKKGFIDGVSITGGEPTFQKDLPEFIKKIKSLGFLVKLDTSGVYPDMVQKILDSSLLDYIAMDIKNTWEKYGGVVQVKNATAIENCKKTFMIIQDSGLDHEFRTTVFPQVHTKDDFFKIAGYLKDGEKYYIQNIRYNKTLDPKINKKAQFDVSAITEDLQKMYPRAIIQKR